MLPTDDQKLDTSLKNMLSNLYEADTPVYDWKFSFRASGVPVCQWYVALAKLYENYPEDLPPSIVSFTFEYYTGVGTRIHEIYQKWLGKLGYLYGDYRCNDCNKLHRGSLGWPKQCTTTKCKGSTWEYVELKLHDIIKDAEFASAHCDGLLRFPWMPKNKYHLLDIKSCSLSTMPTAKFTDPNHIKYLTQTAIYNYILTKMGFEIDKTIFLFVPRDNPRKSTPIMYNQTKMSENMFWSVVNEYKEAKKAYETGDMTSIVKACDTPNDNPTCPFNDLCFSKKLVDNTLPQLFQKKIGRLPILP